MKLLLSILSLVLVIGMSIVGMIYGWGIEPANWGWITASYMSLIIPSLFTAFTE